MPFAARWFRVPALLFTFAALCASDLHAGPKPSKKFDRALQVRAWLGSGRSRVIIRVSPNAPKDEVQQILGLVTGGKGRKLRLINAHATEIPDSVLASLADVPWVEQISEDRLIAGAMERTSATVGAASVRQELGYDGAGIGVAVIDSGITSWHDDLAGSSPATQRVVRFVDFVNGRDEPYDDYGHGTHVAGIVAGNGHDSSGARAGIAPGANLIVLKVLDANGAGHISDVIAALDYVVEHKDELNVRVVNLSMRAGVYESYDSDPLTLAAQHAVRNGIVVVAAAGNLGRSTEGRIQYGGITAPGNAPWVLTVGAASHMGTVDRADDTVAAFSSRGPGTGGYSAKPDIVAPGVGIESLSVPDSTLYATRQPYLLSGTVSTPDRPYLSLSGTSMAAPVVAGTIALMFQANPDLTPNEVKAILQYTAQVHPKYDPLVQGAGFLNAKGAVELARSFANGASSSPPSSGDWGRRIIWGNRLVQGGRLTPDANAWSTSVMWGDLTTPAGRDTRWGEICKDEGCEEHDSRWRAWGVWNPSRNVVWGSLCDGGDCQDTWNPAQVFSTQDDAVVWGMDNDAVVWGMENDAVVWGMSDDSVVWGMECSAESCEPIIWGVK